jgi:hypothetical protein
MKHGARCYFLYTSFCYSIIKNILHRYVFLKKRIASMKFRNKEKFRYGIPAYTGPFRELFKIILFSYIKPGIDQYHNPVLQQTKYRG